MNHHEVLDHLPAANVGSTERAITATLGGVLLAAAVRRGSLLAGVAGGLLVARGLTGYCPAYGLWNQYRQRDNITSPTPDDEEDEVSVAGEDSFPASDPPSFNPGQA